MKMNEELMSQ